MQFILGYYFRSVVAKSIFFFLFVIIIIVDVSFAHHSREREDPPSSLSGDTTMKSYNKQGRRSHRLGKKKTPLNYNNNNNNVRRTSCEWWSNITYEARGIFFLQILWCEIDCRVSDQYADAFTIYRVVRPTRRVEKKKKIHWQVSFKWYYFIPNHINRRLK